MNLRGWGWPTAPAKRDERQSHAKDNIGVNQLPHSLFPPAEIVVFKLADQVDSVGWHLLSREVQVSSGIAFTGLVPARPIRIPFGVCRVEPILCRPVRPPPVVVQ